MNKASILRTLISREYSARHAKPKFIKSLRFDPRGYCLIINRNIIKDLIEELRAEIKETENE